MTRAREKPVVGSEFAGQFEFACYRVANKETHTAPVLKRVLRGAVLGAGLLLAGAGGGLLVFARAAEAQESQAPQIPPPPEHDVRRITGDQPPPEPPPDMAQALIVKHFAEREEEYARARVRFGYKKTIKVTEYGADGNPMGEFSVTSLPVVASDGKLYERVTPNETSTLKTVKLSPEDVNALSKIPSYPLAQSQIEKYTITYAGRERVDEVDCYLYSVKPKFLERANALFQGVIWVDTKYLEIVKSYGKFVNDLGDFHSPQLPFANFETYRENVEGKYWFPNYARSDDRLHYENGDVPIRVVIKWTEFKSLASAPASAPPASKP